MNIDVLKTFCELVETGSFSKTAENSYISQSAVSQQLAKLERELSVELISRGGGVVQPTEAGLVFYEGAQEIVHRHARLLGQVRSAADAVRGVLRVGTIYSVGFYLLEPYTRRFFSQHPQVNLHVEYTKWNRITEAVVSGEMDLGVVACPERHRSLEITPLADEQLKMVCSPEHPLASKDLVDPRELGDQRFVGFEARIPTRRHIDRLLRDRDVRVDVVMEFDNIEVLKRAIEVNAGLSILPAGNVQREAERGDLHVADLDGEGWFRPVAVIRRRGKSPSAAERQLLAILLDR